MDAPASTARLAAPKMASTLSGLIPPLDVGVTVLATITVPSGSPLEPTMGATPYAAGPAPVPSTTPPPAVCVDAPGASAASVDHWPRSGGANATPEASELATGWPLASRTTI